ERHLKEPCHRAPAAWMRPDGRAARRLGSYRQPAVAAARDSALHGLPGAAMTVPDHQARRYRIVAWGESLVMLGGVADGLQTQSGRGWTSVVASVRDETELGGLLDRFQTLAIHIVSVSELGAQVMRSPAVPGGPWAGNGCGPAAGWRTWLGGGGSRGPAG